MIAIVFECSIEIQVVLTGVRKSINSNNVDGLLSMKTADFEILDETSSGQC